MSDPDLTIQFGTPPPQMRGGKRGMYVAAAEALRKRPSEWARIASWPSGAKPDTSLASAICKGKRGFSPAGTFDSRLAKLPDGTHEVWARHLAHPATPSPATPRPPVTPPRAPLPQAAAAQAVVRDLRTPTDDSILCATCGHAKMRHTGDDAPACGRVGCTCVTYRKPVA